MMIMGLCHVGEMKWAMKFMVRMKDDFVMFEVEKHSLVIQHFPDVRQIENELAFLQNMTSGDYLPNSET